MSDHDDEFEAYDFSEFTDQDLRAVDAMLGRRSPFSVFIAPKKHLAVTDLVAPIWCEVQFEYGLYGRRNKPPHLRPSTFLSRRGKTIHVHQQLAHASDRRLERGKASVPSPSLSCSSSPVCPQRLGTRAPSTKDPRPRRLRRGALRSPVSPPPSRHPALTAPPVSSSSSTGSPSSSLSASRYPSLLVLCPRLILRRGSSPCSPSPTPTSFWAPLYPLSPLPSPWLTHVQGRGPLRARIFLCCPVAPPRSQDPPVPEHPGRPRRPLVTSPAHALSPHALHSPRTRGIRLCSPLDTTRPRSHKTLFATVLERHCLYCRWPCTSQLPGVRVDLYRPTTPSPHPGCQPTPTACLSPVATRHGKTKGFRASRHRRPP